MGLLWLARSAASAATAVRPHCEANRPRCRRRRSPPPTTAGWPKVADERARHGVRARPLLSASTTWMDPGGGVAERPVPEPEVQRRAHDDHEVGALEGRAARTGDQVRIARREDAPPHPVGDHGQVARRDEGRGPVDRVDIHTPPPRTRNGCRACWIRRRAPGRPRRGPADRPGATDVGAAPPRGRGEEHVHRDVPEDRAHVRAAGQGERTVAVAADLARVVGGPRALGDGRQDRRLIELLERDLLPSARPGTDRRARPWASR